MTQAENPAEQAPLAPPAAPQTQDSDISEKLSVESIGWLFVQKYYSTYAGEIEKLYAFYDQDASLLHDEISAAEEKTHTVHLASGTDAIRKHFQAQKELAEANKIVIERADFQKSVGDSILIVVCGLWKKGAGELLQFVQTFLLKSKGKTVYDISNDLLKFVNLSETFSESEVKEVESNGNGAVEPEQEAEVVANEEVPETIEEPQAEKEEVAVAEPKIEDSEPAEKIPESAPQPVESAPAAPETPSAPLVKPTWANLAAIEPKTGKISQVSAPVAKPTAAPPKKATSPAQQPQQAQTGNGKYKKEEWYPIYVRNIEVEDDELRTALVQNFGDIKFFKRSNKAALVDFKNKEDQQKALETKEIVINGNAILLEPRLLKSANGKTDFKKDKKQVKKNGAKKF